MNSELVKWLIHQPALVVAAFCMGAILEKAHPDLLCAENLVMVLATVAGIGGGAMSWAQADPLAKPEGTDGTKGTNGGGKQP
jgi:hypothetical protein